MDDGDWLHREVRLEFDNRGRLMESVVPISESVASRSSMQCQHESSTRNPCPEYPKLPRSSACL